MERSFGEFMSLNELMLHAEVVWSKIAHLRANDPDAAPELVRAQGAVDAYRNRLKAREAQEEREKKTYRES